MKPQPSLVVNATLLKRIRLQRGWTQAEMARRAGYSERLIRKAELGGKIRYEVVADLAACLSEGGSFVSIEDITQDPLRIAQWWMNTFDQVGRTMLAGYEHYFTSDFVFHCAGSTSDSFPFNGTWHGLEGHQEWLDLFFGIMERVQGIDVTYTVGTDMVSARWNETVKIHGILCPPVRVNMHFFFRDGRICRMEDDYDTKKGDDHLRAVMEQVGQQQSVNQTQSTSQR